MSQKPGRNQPCWCGSGTKYKKCCLPKDEGAAREAAQQAALLAPAGWDEEDHSGYEFVPDDDLLDDDLDLDEDFILDVSTIVRVCYTRGLVNGIADYRAGRGLRITEWSEPSIPQSILDAIEDEDLGGLVGRWGDHSLAEPIQVDVIDIETNMDVITVEAFNRRVAMLTVPDDEMTRIERACELLEELAAEGTLPDLDASAIPADEGPLDDADEE